MWWNNIFDILEYIMVVFKVFKELEEEVDVEELKEKKKVIEEKFIEKKFIEKKNEVRKDDGKDMNGKFIFESRGLEKIFVNRIKVEVEFKVRKKVEIKVLSIGVIFVLLIVIIDKDLGRVSVVVKVF